MLAPVIPQVGALIARHPGTLSLAQGMVNWGPPPAVLEAIAAVLALAAADPAAMVDLDRYGPLQGDPELLAALSARLVRQQRFDPSISALLVTAGSNMAFQVLIQVLCDPGDAVLLPVPWYFNHAMAVQLAGATPLPVQAGLILDPERLEAAITPRCRAIVTVSPGNPSGVVQPPAVLEQINRICERHGLLHISDEAYGDFVFGSVPHRSPAARPGAGEHTVTLHSFSKAYGMAGWRLGYATVPKRLLPALEKGLDTTLICAPRISQRAGVAALAAGEAWLQPHLRDLAQRRRQLLASLATGGDRLNLLVEPDGAFYALVAIPTPRRAMEVVQILIERHGVAALPGDSFAVPAPAGQAVLRLSYGMLDSETLAEALERLQRGVAELATPA